MPVVHACPSCGAPLETPLGCGACHALFETASGLSPYDVLGIEPTAAPDAKDLRARLLRFSRIVHPDYYGADEKLRARAETNTARLNESYGTLADDFARLDWIVKQLGGPTEADERQMPQAFLMEVLEWNEALEEAREAPAGAPLPASLAALETTWKSERANTLAAATRRLTPLPEAGTTDLSPTLTGVRKNLNAVRYLDRALRELEALRLARAATR